MRARIRTALLIASLALCGVFLLFLVNQTNQVVELASGIGPAVGRVVLYGLLLLYAVAIAVPVYIYVTMPKPLVPPAEEDSPEFAKVLDALRRRLEGNTHLRSQGLDLSTRDGLNSAIAQLDALAEEAVRRTASTVFVTTAISQSGRLDAFVVLGVQTRMVWEIAHIFSQRPPLRELLHLYANVGGTAFLAMELDDVDIASHIEPVVSNVLGGSIAGVIPGAGGVASFVTNSILDGSANAFLTLRVGLIARSYCHVLLRPDRRLIRRSATAQAAQMLGAIVVQSAGKISKAAWGATKKRASRLNPFRSARDEPDTPNTA